MQVGEGEAGQARLGCEKERESKLRGRECERRSGEPGTSQSFIHPLSDLMWCGWA